MLELWNNYQFRKQLNKFVEAYSKDEEKSYPLFKAMLEFGSEKNPGEAIPQTLPEPEQPAFTISPKKRRRRTKEQIASGVTLDQLVDEDTPPPVEAPLSTIKAKLRSMAATKSRRDAIRGALTPEDQKRIDEENRKNQVDILQRVKEAAEILLASVKKDGFDSNGERKVILAGHRYAGAQLNEYMAGLGYKISVRKSMQNVHAGSNAESGAGQAGGGWEVVVTR